MELIGYIQFIMKAETTALATRRLPNADSLNHFRIKQFPCPIALFQVQP
jgi:hypothetical protein